MAVPEVGSGTLYIDGKWRHSASGQTFAVTDPATSQVLEQISAAQTEDVRDAVNAAAGAFGSWSARTAYERSGYLYDAHRLMLERADELARLMTTEQGKPLRTARIEVQYAADFLIWFAEEAKRVYGQMIPSSRADQRFMVLHQPAGVVNLVTASRARTVGDEFLANPAVRKLTFTGSTEVGKRLAEGAAAQIKRVSLELGGHAPFIVFPDADPAHAARGASLVKFLNTGQACICPNRIFVHRSIAEPFLSVLAERVGRLKAGSGLEEGVTIGPLIDEGALAKMDERSEEHT